MSINDDILWLISYEVKTRTSTHKFNEVINVHPVHWLLNANECDEDEYFLINSIKVPKTAYKESRAKLDDNAYV